MGRSECWGGGIWRVLEGTTQESDGGFLTAELELLWAWSSRSRRQTGSFGASRLPWPRRGPSLKALGRCRRGSMSCR